MKSRQTVICAAVVLAGVLLAFGRTVTLATWNTRESSDASLPAAAPGTAATCASAHHVE